MAKARIMDIPETKLSDFALVGKVSGIKSDKFYGEGKGRSGKPWRRIGFSVEYEKDRKIYVEIFGNAQDNVYFYKQNEIKGQKGDTKKVPWANRATFKEDEYIPIGVTCGLKKNEDGKSNESVVLPDFDACERIANDLRELGDGAVVRVIGKISHTKYTNKKGDVTNQSKFIIQRIYLSGSDIENKEAEKKNHYFHQAMVVTGISNDKENKRAEIEGYVVNYADIQDVTFYSRNTKLISNLQKQLKGNKDNIGIAVYGEIEASIKVEEVIEEDEWGEVDASKVQYAPAVIEFYATGADKETLELDVYSQEAIETAMEKIKTSEQAEDKFHGNSKEEIVLETASAEDEDAFAMDWED